jgi:hypothetical protein
MTTTPFLLPSLLVPGATVAFPRQEGPAMSATVRALLAALLIVGGMCAGVLVAAAPAHAYGPCLFQGDWNCYGPPQWNGQLQPTWEVPPYTWPNNRLQCNPGTNRCYPVAPGGGY